MITIRLVDDACREFGTDNGNGPCLWRDPHLCESVLQAAERLSSQVESGHVTCCSLNGRRRPVPLDGVLHCSPTRTECFGQYGSNRRVKELSFTTSHYVGEACVRSDCDQIRFVINPRMGAAIWSHLLAEATRVYLPERLTSVAGQQEDGSAWLLLMMWRSAFERAIRQASVPKAYVQTEENMRCFRGRLNVPRHISLNIADQSRFFCSYKPLTFDNAINRTIRCVYRVLSASRIPASALVSIAEYDSRLASFGVENRPVSDREIASFKYTKMTEPYRAVMELSRVILRGYGAGEMEGGGDGPSYFIDVAEIWENYLMGVLKRRIPEYTFVSPNEEGGCKLFEDAREIRPDFMVYRNGKLIAIMDAKYKRYNKIGRYAIEDHAVSREDLYQMSTYLYRFGSSNEPLAGIFLSPFSVGDNSQKRIGNNPRHFMAVCNLPIIDLDRECANWDRTKLQARLKEVEGDFAARLKKLLDGCLS